MIFIIAQNKRTCIAAMVYSKTVRKISFENHEHRDYNDEITKTRKQYMTLKIVIKQ